MRKKIIPSFIFLVVLTMFWLVGQRRANSSKLAAAIVPPPVLLDSTHQALVDQFEVYLRSQREQFPVPAFAVAIVKDSHIVYERTWGVRSLNGNRPIDQHTAFRLASLSKGFAPVLAGILVEKGLLDWSDPIVEYVPDLQLNDAEATRTLTLEHVLSHTTGLPRHAYSNLINIGRPYRKMLSMLREVQLTHPPGTYYNYQNLAYSLSGDVVERVGGDSYGKLMEEYVFRPAGMTTASVGYEAMDSLANKAYPHRPGETGYYQVDLEPDWYAVGPAAGVNASIRDMGQWLMLLMGNRSDIIADSTLDKIFTPYVSVSARESNLRPWRAGLEASWYALGWRIMDYYGRRIIYHGGYVNSYRTEIAFDRERKIGVVILSSAPAPFIGDCLPAFFDLYREMVLQQGSGIESNAVSRN